MSLNADEKKLLAELQQRENEPENDSDYEIEIYKGEHGARIPYSKGKSFLQSIFGIDLDSDSESEPEGEGSTAPESSPSSKSGYFNRR